MRNFSRKAWSSHCAPQLWRLEYFRGRLSLLPLGLEAALSWHDTILPSPQVLNLISLQPTLLTGIPIFSFFYFQILFMLLAFAPCPYDRGSSMTHDEVLASPPHQPMGEHSTSTKLPHPYHSPSQTHLCPFLSFTLTSYNKHNGSFRFASSNNKHNGSLPLGLVGRGKAGHNSKKVPRIR